MKYFNPLHASMINQKIVSFCPPSDHKVNYRQFCDLSEKVLIYDNFLTIPQQFKLSKSHYNTLFYDNFVNSFQGIDWNKFPPFSVSWVNIKRNNYGSYKIKGEVDFEATFVVINIKSYIA